MGTPLIQGVYLGLILCSTVLTLVSVALTTKTTQQVFKQVFPEENDIRSTKTRPHASSGELRRKRKIRTTLIYVFLSSLMFTLGLIASLAYYVIVYLNLKVSGNKLSERKKWTGVVPLTWISDGFVIIGYLYLNLSYLGRYQSTFVHTRYQFSDNTMRIVYAVMITVVVFAIMMSVFANQENYKVTLILSILVFVSLPPFSIWQIGSFYYATHRVASELNDNFVGSADSNDRRRINELFHVSLRLTVVSSVAVLSGVLLGCMIMLHLSIPEWKPFVVFYSVCYGIDSVVNIYALLCCFKQTEHYYQFLFGRLHDWLYHRFFVNQNLDIPPISPSPY